MAQQQRQQQMLLLLLSLLLPLLLAFPQASAASDGSLFPQQQQQQQQQQQEVYRDLLADFFESSHGDVHAVIVSTSRQYQNYRHMTNALSIYTILKQQGLPDGNIVLMLAGADGPCTPRNPFPAGVYRRHTRKQNLFGGHDICASRLAKKLQQQQQQQQEQPQQQQKQNLLDEIASSDKYGNCAVGARGWEGAAVDFAGDEVTVGALLSVLTGMQKPHVPKHKRLHSSEKSGVVVFLSGHGGDEFLKFSDWEILLQEQLAETIQIMRALKRFKNMLLIAETCQAATLLAGVHTPGVLRVSSSLKGESSYSFVGDAEVGTALIDRFSQAVSSYLNKQANRETAAAAAGDSSSSSSSNSRGVGRLGSPVSKMLKGLEYSFLLSHCGIEEMQTSPESPSLTSLPLSSFFSNRQKLACLPPLAYPASTPHPPASAAAAATAAAAAEPLRLWHSAAFGLAVSADPGHNQQQQQQQQQQQELLLLLQQTVERLEPQVALPLAVALAFVACAATSALLF